MQVRPVRRLLHRQFLAATIAAAGQDPAAVLGAHAGTEAVNLIALAFLGLISTFHDGNNSFNSEMPYGIDFARCDWKAPQDSHYSIAARPFPVK